MDPTIASLISDAGKLLRKEFEFVRETNPHSGDAGQEVEDKLKKFLDERLPRRWSAVSGIVIDHKNQLSRQQDVMIYDAMMSPAYRAGTRTHVVPYNGVGAVIEVKSTLNKKELKDAYEKISSVKKLSKDRLTNLDIETPGGSDGGTLGIVFAFSADTSLTTLAENAKELNTQFPSSEWPDLIVILDVGTIMYGVSYPGDTTSAQGHLITLPEPAHLEYPPPPWYIHLRTHEDGDFTLNRFFMLLTTHLSLFPFRRQSPPFEKTLGDAPKVAMTITGYQFATDFLLKPVPEEMYGKGRKPLKMNLFVKKNVPVGEVHYISWQDGAVLRSFGMPLGMYIKSLMDIKKEMMFADPRDPSVHLTSVLKLTEKEFRKWPYKVGRHNLRGEIVEPE